jgi:hypothetical protein
MRGADRRHNLERSGHGPHLYAHRLYTERSREEYLWYLLHTPQFSPSELTDEKLRYWQEHDEERRSAQTVLAGLGHTDKYSIYDYLEILYGLKARSNVGNYAALGLLIASIVLLLINAQAGVLVLVAVLIYNMISYYREKRDNDQYIVVFRYVLRMIEAGRRLAGTCTGPGKKRATSLSVWMRNLRRSGAVRAYWYPAPAVRATRRTWSSTTYASFCIWT